MNRLFLFPIASMLVVGLSAHHRVPRIEPAGLSAEDAAMVRSVVPPTAGEDSFAAIPWQVNLWDARRLAAAEGKPIFLWEMDGHPLGCG